MSQGDLLMQRKRQNNGEFADQEQTRRHPNATGTLHIPSRKSVADAPQTLSSLKRSSMGKGRPSVMLTAPTSGALSAGNGGSLTRQRQTALDSMDSKNRQIIEDRKREEDEVKALGEMGRAEYHAMLREKERMRLRQRTQAREELQDKTLPALCGSARTVAAAHREAKKTLPQQAYLETNRDRMEVNFIRRQEELESTRRKQAARRDLEETAGTQFAQSQSKLRNTLNVSAGRGLCSTAGTVVTPEEVHAVELVRQEELWQEEEEERDIKRAMDELDALDKKLYQEELQRKEVRMAKKKELREASMRPK